MRKYTILACRWNTRAHGQSSIGSGGTAVAAGTNAELGFPGGPMFGKIAATTKPRHHRQMTIISG